MFTCKGTLGLASSVQEAIIETLAQNGPQQISSLLSRFAKSATRQSVYQEVRKLSQKGIVFKVGKTVALRLGWILELQTLAETMYTTALQDNDLWLPQAEDKRRWYVSSLPQAMNLWANLAMTLLRESGSELLEWTPHAWFHLVDSKMEIQSLSVVQKQRVRYYLIVGHDTYLDRSYEPHFRRAGTAIAYSRSPFASLQQECFSVIGDHLIRVVLPAQLSREIHSLYATVKKSPDVTISEVNRVLGQRTKIRVEVLRNAQRCSVIRRKFLRYFGTLSKAGA